VKVSLSWLREFVEVPWSGKELGSRLTMAGFELESIDSAAPPFNGVVIAEIVQAVRHPQADKLQVCKVRAGAGALQIVCGAANARAGMKTALATVGAKLPGDKAITAAKLRGVESFGMLCSAKELGLADTSEGIIELPADAPVGTELRAYLDLDDEILELNVTPNRGDAMSVLGIAREVSALTRSAVRMPVPANSTPLHDTFRVKLAAPSGCPKFTCRIVRGIDNSRPSPPWLRERLRRAGLRAISPVVDITQYVMLELGQPMHAYDLAKLKGGLEARLARQGGKNHAARRQGNRTYDDVLVIADTMGPVGMAGSWAARARCAARTRRRAVRSGVLPPAAIAGRGRRYGLVTDAGQRFERGVDPAHQERAIERATELLLQIAGGKAGHACRAGSDALPKRLEVRCAATHQEAARHQHRRQRRQGDAGVARHARAGERDGWLVTPPSHRSTSRSSRTSSKSWRAWSASRRSRSRRDGLQKVRRWPNRRRSKRRRSRSWRRAATRKPSRTRSSIRRCRPNYSRRRHAGAQQRDLQRHVRHARRCGRAHQGRARQPAPPAGSHPAVRTRRAIRSRRRDRSARGIAMGSRSRSSGA
jgi:phenylalanyl-tRNA synthetase beta chain